jgi:hypothetical protein
MQHQTDSGAVREYNTRTIYIYIYIYIYILCIYLRIHAVKNRTNCQIVALCNIQLHVPALKVGHLVPPKLLLYSHLTGSMNNLMMAHLQGQNM